jgi:hypothetical protein
MLRPFYLRATIIDLGPVRCSEYIFQNPASRIHLKHWSKVYSNPPRVATSMFRLASKPLVFFKRLLSSIDSYTMSAPSILRDRNAFLMRNFFLFRSQSCRMCPIIKTSALGTESLKKSPATNLSLFCNPNDLTYSSKGRLICGRSNPHPVKCRWGGKFPPPNEFYCMILHGPRSRHQKASDGQEIVPELLLSLKI